MKVTETLLAASVLGLAGFIGIQSLEARNVRTHSEAAGAFDAPAAPAVTRGKRGAKRPASTTGGGTPAVAPIAGMTVAGMPTNPAPVFAEVASVTNRGEKRRRIAQSAAGTYIDELLVSRDSALARWPERVRRPLRVWVEEATSVEGWTDEFPSAVRDAFLTWGEAGIPLRFDFVRDSASADIEVRFVERLANGISGKTVWSRDGDWWLVSSDIQLALVHPSGGVVSAPQMRAIALHEVGHLLGLDHSTGTENIMAARVRVRELSEQDRATVRLLYSVPAGSLK